MVGAQESRALIALTYRILQIQNPKERLSLQLLVWLDASSRCRELEVDFSLEQLPPVH